MSTALNLLKTNKLNLDLIKTILFNNRYYIRFKNVYLILTQKLNNSYTFEKSKYSDSFIGEHNISPNPPFKKVKPIIYCFWTGYNAMSGNRKRSLELLKSKANVEVCLITPNNLEAYILPDAPLHPSYKHLSLVHKSDYLRCYFMNFYGGGYSDIKEPFYEWSSYFQKINNQKDKIIMGPTEKSFDFLAKLDGNIKRDLERNFKKIISASAIICKPQTMFTQEWYKELLVRMDMYYDLLKENPGNERGNNEGYPIPWTNILGNIFHPLCLKYHNFIIHEPKMKPNTNNYL